jgi:hypothetical protein
MITHRPCLDVAVLHALTRESRNHLGERTTRERGGATHPRRMARMGCVSTAKEGTAVVTCALRVARGGIRDAPRGQVGSRPLQLVALADRARVRHVLRAARPSGVLVAISLAWRRGARWEECSRRARRNARPPLLLTPHSSPLFVHDRPPLRASPIIPRCRVRPADASGSWSWSALGGVRARSGGGVQLSNYTSHVAYDIDLSRDESAAKALGLTLTDNTTEYKVRVLHKRRVLSVRARARINRATERMRRRRRRSQIPHKKRPRSSSRLKGTSAACHRLTANGPPPAAA